MSKRKFRINVDPQSLVPIDSVRRYYFASLIVLMVLTGLIFLFYGHLPHSIPLFFTEPWGVARLVPKLYLYSLVIISLVVIVVNVMIGKMMNIDNNKVLIYSLGIGSLAVTITLLLSFVGIIQSIL